MTYDVEKKAREIADAIHDRDRPTYQSDMWDIAVALREAVEQGEKHARMAQGYPYRDGYRAGLERAAELARSTTLQVRLGNPRPLYSEGWNDGVKCCADAIRAEIASLSETFTERGD